MEAEPTNNQVINVECAQNPKPPTPVKKALNKLESFRNQLHQKFQ